MDHIQHEDETTNYVCIAAVNKVLNMICRWIEDPDSYAVKLHLSRIKDYLWLAEDGMKMKAYNGSQLWDVDLGVQAILATNLCDEYGSMLRKAHFFINVSQIKEDCGINLGSWYRDSTKGGWTFSTLDQGWPVSDCTAEALEAALRLSRMPENVVGKAIEPSRLYDAVDLILSLQTNSGGFSTYELPRSYQWLEMLNPSESLGKIMVEYPYVECTSSAIIGLKCFTKLHPVYRRKEIEACINKALTFILTIQLPDGSWYGSYGVCYTYGTWFGIRGLVAGGNTYETCHSIRKACDFLLSKQLPSGGWGESYLSGQDKVYTNIEGNKWHIVNTAWAMMALIEAGQRAATGRTSTLAQPPADAPPPPLLLRRSCTGHRNSVSVARPSPTAPRTATASPHGPRLPAQPPPAEPATAQLPLPAAAPASRNSFKESLENSNGFATWNASIPPCKGWRAYWEGVICANGTVRGLNLNNRGLGGSIDVEALAELPLFRSFSAMNNSFDGDLPAFYRVGALKNLKLSRNKFSGEIDDTFFSGMRSLKKLYLSHNEFEGTIPASLIISKRLLELKLNDNAFEGKIPYMKVPRIKFVNFSDNHLEGEIPTTFSRFPASSFKGNLGLCGKPLKPCTMPELSMTTLIVVGIVVGAAILAIVAVIIILRQPKPADLEEGAQLPSSHRRMASVDFDKFEVSPVDSCAKSEPGLRLTFLRDDRERFDLASLLKASAEILGSGVFGSTYKAALNDGPVLVVKRFRQMNHVGKEDFYEHMRRLGSLNHKNLVPIAAFYYRKEEKLLVADYVQNVSLAVHLHVNGNETLDWPTRLKIMKGVARGLMFLYNELPDLIVPHGHLKSSNVLLDATFEPMHGDYGLLPVVNMEHAQEHMIAYKSPEYRQRGRISKKTDVWALGILIVETLTGKLPSGFLQQGKSNDADIDGWVQTVAPEDATPEVFDKNMKGITPASEGQMMKLLKIGLRCCEVDVEKRWDIKEAVERIEEVRERDDDDEHAGDGQESHRVSSRGESHQD
nr:probable LRR receptor-like serine/threonine-protein kinase At4g31250 [Ipomoea trifida]